MILIVDASVAVKWLVEEPDSATADAVLREADEVIAPDVVLAETANALWRRQRQKMMTRHAAEEKLKVLPGKFDALLPHTGIIVEAARIGFDLDRPVYDCLYLALAEREDGMLVTADTRLAERVKRTAWRRRITPLDRFAAKPRRP
jgi:predicted nucleic acid-binding protein